jgi:hypothetical protein
MKQSGGLCAVPPAAGICVFAGTAGFFCRREAAMVPLVIVRNPARNLSPTGKGPIFATGFPLIRNFAAPQRGRAKSKTGRLKPVLHLIIFLNNGQQKQPRFLPFLPRFLHA